LYYIFHEVTSKKYQVYNPDSYFLFKKGVVIMSNSDLNTSLKYENVNLQEDLIFFKAQNIYLNGKIQDLEDEKRELKRKLVKLTVVKGKMERNYHLNHRLGAHFPDKLIKQEKSIA